MKDNRYTRQCLVQYESHQISLATGGSRKRRLFPDSAALLNFEHSAVPCEGEALTPLYVRQVRSGKVVSTPRIASHPSNRTYYEGYIRSGISLYILQTIYPSHLSRGDGYIVASALRRKTWKVIGFRKHASESQSLSSVPT